MNEREPMSSKERLREALEEIKFLHDHHVIHLDGCSFANDMGHIALNVLASTEPEQPASEGEDCEFCNGDGIIRGEAPGGKVVEVAYCPNQCKSSRTEGEE